ncbi:putative protein kinase [Leptomonas seymouri]|uniref:non-specific serine/threonine protein kinase n=1 Tax=Leptomonas seymouri TaxID=5684 RepID=A0A0N0P464_LEPSE|nr:putative protein kinase [Leptomonas seymouri]|eukprot:KPI84467.1 putative protein kinase [Leptomonas seymouri]
MSSRGVSVSWGDSESFIGEPAAKGSYASSGFLRTSSHNAKVLSFSHSCPSQYWEANPSASGASAAKQMTANDLDWLKPWRTPQDGRGGFALLCSMQEILCNVQRARLSSMKEVYSPLCSRSGSVSNRLVDTWDGNASLSSTLRLSMRRGNRRPRLTASTTAPATGAEGGGAGEVLNSSVTSMGSTSKSATLMDYMLSDGRMWQTSHMWLDDSTLPRPTTDTARSSSDHAGELRQRPAQGRRDAPPLCDVEAPPPQRSAAAAVEGGGGAARPAASTGVVPPIPHFEELQAIQAELQRLQQANPSHHPRSEAAQRRLRLLTHSSDEDSAHEEADTRYDGSPGAHLQVTACLTPGTGSGTARPAPPPPPQFNSTVNCSDADESSSPSSSPRQEHGLYCDDRLSLTDAEDEEDVSDCMSVTNFGEDGHLACVPGDTLHGRYTLLQVLGVGRSSRVWLAADLEQCSHTRRHLIRELGEREARRLFRPSEHPMFVALKVFRCGAMYTDCATYEAKLSAFVKDSVKLRPLRLLRSPPSSLMSPLISPTSVKASTTPSPTGGSSSGDRGPAARPCVGRPRANSSTPFVGSPSPRLPAPGNATRTAGISHPSQRLSTFRDQFAVEGQYGTHQCLVMDVLGSGIDTAINETHLAGFPSEVARSILLSSLQGLALLAACNVIHADLKPENLLFTDLDADVASAMRAFQSVQLQTGCRSALWSSFTHQRESVREFAQRVERESASLAASASVAAENGNSPHATVAATHAETEEGALHLDANGDLSGSQCVAPPQDHMAQRQADLSAPGHSSRLHSAAAAAATTKDEVGGSDGRRRCPGLTCSALSATRDGDGSAAPTPPRARRPAYEVRVSDFGLSFITPPCLRLGVRALARYADEVGTTVDDLVHDDALSQLQWLYEQQQQQPPQSPSGARVAGLSPLEMARCSNNIGSSRSAGWECGAAAPEWTVDCELIDEAELRALQLEDARGLHSEDDVVGETEGAGEGDAVADTAAEDESVAGNGAAATTATVAVEFTSVMSVGVAAAGSPSKRQKKKNYPHSTQPSHAMSSVNCSTNHSSCSVDDRHVSAGNTPDSPLMDRLAAAAVAPPVALQTASYHSPVSKTFTVLPSAALMASSPHSAPHDEDEEGLDATAPSPLSLFSSPNDAPILARHKGRGGAVDGNAVASTVSTTRMSLACPSAFQLPPPASTAGVTPSRQARHAEPVSLRQPRRSPAFAQTSLTSLRRLEVSILRSQQYARGIVMQSREYRAPEVLLGYFALPSCDVWSIGCIAYELVTGRFLIDCIADRERHGRQLARHVHGGGGGQTRASSECESCAEDEDYGGIEWDGQPIYVEDNEQDLSIFQLKSMMRLLGPPPIAFLHQHPTGLFVGDYYDENGDFKYWDGVENACGVGVVDANRRQELRASEGRWRSCSSSSSSSDGRGHPPAAAAPTSIHSKVTKGNGRCLACDNEEVGEGGGEGGEARVAPHGSRHRAHDLIEPPSHVESSSGVPAVPADYRSLRRSPHAAPFDTRNYAVETPGWLEVRRTLRRKLKSEEEARDFESFMWKCLQWDPAQRATAAELLADDWIMKYSHKVASAVDSDGEGGGGCDGVEPKLEV